MVGEKNKLIQKISDFLKSNKKVLSEWCYAIVAIGTGILGIFNFISTQIVISIFCGLIGIILISFISHHKRNINIESMLSEKFNEMEDIVRNSTSCDLDALFYQNNEACESEIISSAINELILVQETGNLIIERNKATIRNFLQNGGKLTIIVCSDNNTTQSFLAFRNEDLHNCSEIDIRLKNFLNQINSTVETALLGRRDLSLQKNVVIRFCPYPVAITAVYSPDAHIKKAVIRLADFKASYQKKISLLVEETKFPRLYEHYQHQIANYHLYAFKKILITGRPHIGKTTLIKQLIDNFEISQDAPIYYCYTKEVIRSGKRVGYEVVTSTNPTPSCLATRNEARFPLHYDVDINLLNTIANEIKSNQNKILVVDEIGLMQMQSTKFKEAIFQIMHKTNCVLIGTVSLDSSSDIFLERIKTDPLCECIEYTRDNHNVLLSRLDKELAAALHMYSLVKENERG